MPRSGRSKGRRSRAEDSHLGALNAKPARKPARSEVLLLGDEGRRRGLQGAGRFRSGEEVHVHASDLAVTELDVAGILALVRLWPGAPAKLRTESLRNDLRGSFSKHAGLGCADAVDIAYRV